MRLALLIALLPGLALGDLDGGTPTIDTYDCPPAPLKVEMDGGYFISYARDERLACIIVASQKERDLWKVEAQTKPPSWVAWVAIVGAGLAAGYALGRLTR